MGVGAEQGGQGSVTGFECPSEAFSAAGVAMGNGVPRELRLVAQRIRLTVCAGHGKAARLAELAGALDHMAARLAASEATCYECRVCGAEVTAHVDSDAAAGRWACEGCQASEASDREADEAGLSVYVAGVGFVPAHTAAEARAAVARQEAAARRVRPTPAAPARPAVGQRVMFTTSPSREWCGCVLVAGDMGTVALVDDETVEVRPDRADARRALDEWDGCVVFSAEDGHALACEAFAGAGAELEDAWTPGDCALLAMWACCTPADRLVA